MVVGVGTITLRMPEIHSLKGKRGIVKTMIGRIRSRFNVSVSEVQPNNSHSRAKIGFTMVGTDARLINSKMDKLLNMAESMMIAEIIDQELEMIHF